MATKYEDIRALNWSSLKTLVGDGSPRLYQHRVASPRSDTASYALGRAIHCAILEPDEMPKRYAAAPPGMKFSTKEGKAWKAEAIEAGLEVLSPSDVATVAECQLAFERHQGACAILGGCQTEVSITWGTDPVRKGRLDAVARYKLVDLKTSSKPLARFHGEAASYLYHAQLAWYRDGAVEAGILDENADVYIIAVETCEPYDVGVFHLGLGTIEAGRRVYEDALDLWRSCTETGLWPGRCPSIQSLELPGWAAGME